MDEREQTVRQYNAVFDRLRRKVVFNMHELGALP
jgi:hypothetical protein